MGGQENAVFIASKPFMGYVSAVVMQFTSLGYGEVVIKARGQFMSRAIDVCEVVRNQFLVGKVDLAEDGIKIGSEDLTNKDDKLTRVSFIELTLKKI